MITHKLDSTLALLLAPFSLNRPLPWGHSGPGEQCPQHSSQAETPRPLGIGRAVMEAVHAVADNAVCPLAMEQEPA